MTNLGRKWTFKRSMVADAPDTAGVYALWDNETLLVVGHANGGDDSLRARLIAHLERAEGTGTPTHYSWQICSDPRARKAELLAQAGSVAMDAPETAGETAGR